MYDNQAVAALDALCFLRSAKDEDYLETLDRLLEQGWEYEAKHIEGGTEHYMVTPDRSRFLLPRGDARPVGELIRRARDDPSGEAVLRSVEEYFALRRHALEVRSIGDGETDTVQMHVPYVTGEGVEELTFTLELHRYAPHLKHSE